MATNTSLRSGSRTRSVGLVAVAVVVLALAVGGIARTSQASAGKSMSDAAAGQTLVSSVLDLESAVRGFALTGDDVFVDRYDGAFAEFLAAVDVASRVRGGGAAARALQTQVDIALEWDSLARLVIDDPDAGTRAAADRARTMERNAVLERFRDANDEFQALVEREHQANLRTASVAAVAAVVVGAVLLSLAHHLLVGRPAAREHRYQAARFRLRGALQIARDASAVVDAVADRLGGESRGAALTVLGIEDGRLVALGDTRIADATVGAGPGDCLAVANQRTRARTDATTDRCSVCEVLACPTRCTPLLVGGELIGSAVLVDPGERPDRAARCFDDVVADIGPILASLEHLDRLANEAATDPLTGLANRRAGDRALQRLASQAGRLRSPLSVLVIDVDRFKAVNDRYGHDVGDTALEAVARVIDESIRTSDLAVRFGGEEFLVALPDTDLDGAAVVADKVRLAVAAAELDGLADGITVSIGVSSMPADAGTVDGLVRVADRRLLQAKRDGRNRVVVAASAVPA